MTDLETELATLETSVAEAQKAAEALRKTLHRLRGAVRAGNLADLEKGLSAAAERAQEAEAASRTLAGAWCFDARGYLSRGYADELRAAAEAAGLSLFERDGRLYAFPLLLRIEPQEGAVRVGRKRERRIRPTELVRLIAAIQKRPQRFREAQLLEVLQRVYQRLAGSEWRKLERGPGPAVSLADMHNLLTLLPGADYPVEEFGRDLLLLDRQPDLRTRDGSTFEFPGSTLSKERMQRIAVYDEHGRERAYVAMRFVKEP